MKLFLLAKKGRFSSSENVENNFGFSRRMGVVEKVQGGSKTDLR